ncbi:o-succinylbenzoate--CoA ligase [Vibrio algicola]|nr:o-succinylbenzoate--CoA ligase [Vibrio algicola]
MNDMIQHWHQKSVEQANMLKAPAAKAVALKTADCSYSWQQLDQKIDAVAQNLVTQGLAANNIVAAVGKNHPDMVILYLACVRLGALCALIPPQSPALLQQKLDIIQAQFLWLGEGCSALDSSLFTAHPTHNAQIVALQIDGVNNSGASTVTSRSNPQLNQYQPTNPASIVFTSGSTGTPKAVVHLAKQHLASAQGLIAEFEFNAQDSWLLSLPMYHVSGLSIIWRWLSQGAQLVIGSGELICDLQGVTHASLVPTQLQRVLDAAVSAPLKLKRVLLGGAHIPVSLTNQAAEQGIECWAGYGMTETASNVIAKKCDGSPTAGHVLAHRKIKLQQGRIYVAGEVLAAGYLSQGKLTPLVTQQQPWFDTKDLGIEHELKEDKGDLCEIEIVGRADNLFTSGGENIHCEEIEAALIQHPQISQAIVIPVADAQYGHRPIAFLQTTSLQTEPEYKAFLLSYLDKFKCPDGYFLIPRSLLSTGIKISRAELKRYYLNSIKVMKDQN